MKKLFAFVILLSACAHQTQTTNKIVAPTWNESLASKFVKLSIDCVDKEFPNYWERLNIKNNPKSLHAAFYGCYDWHSAVHGHWAMLRVLRLLPEIPEKNILINKLFHFFFLLSSN
jgi:hypothetical protein